MPAKAEAFARVALRVIDGADRFERLQHAFSDCRRRTVALTEGLSDADATVQSMNDASPAKWHLAHTTWYFEAFVLETFDPGYEAFDPRFGYLFNSYYESLGTHHARPLRGMLTRPDLATVLRYRACVERAVERVLEQAARSNPQRAGRLGRLVELGIQHEQQHQELVLTDLLHLFAQNPLAPVYRDAPARADANARDDAPAAPAEPSRYVEFDGGRVAIGHDGSAFSYDCERPAHEVLLRPYALAGRPVTNGEWMAFIDDGGYRNALLWLSDGWDRVRAEQWQAPLYWRRDDDGAWRSMTLHGERALDANAPVVHISYYEADAFARWAGKRLPTEFEWEAAARRSPAHAFGGASVHCGGDTAPVLEGHFADDALFVPTPARRSHDAGLQQLFGDVWEWTSSSFASYPGFRPEPGAAAEYNGKFMCGQYVLRGGSCATPRGHVRATYRNFFPPPARWQFSGVRLAEDRS